MGPTGPAGSGTVFTANIYNTTASNFYFPPNASGDPTVGGNLTTFAQTGVPMPVACTFDSIYLQPGTVGANLGSGGSLTVTLYKNAAATALTVTGTEGSVNPAVSPVANNLVGASVSVSAGDVISLYASGPGVNNGTGPLSVSMHCK